mmetsp:Transcript_88751/g.185566  ORF Transcript_88751/g.185566 Transcript_88751/m.185566 type:complete len:224 (+) Transcript_88751:180-851(+)
MSRKHITPVLFHKNRLPKEHRSPIVYGWFHNTPWSRYNHFAYFWSEKRPIRKTVVNHTQRVAQVRRFGMMFDDTPTVIQDLSQDGPYTLFCPTDAAMDLVKEDAWENLFDEEKALFMRHHAVRGKWGIEDIAAAAGKPTRPVDYVDLTTYERPGPYNKAFFAEPLKAPMLSLADQKLEVEVTGELKDMNRIVKVGGAQIVKSNIRCWNGYVHFIDRPLRPKRM